MINDKYAYDAFISYRHIPHDKKIAEAIQRILETYNPPSGLSFRNTGKIKRIFRDQSELPTSGDLGADIEKALRESRYLICVCSPEYTESEWCLKEIEYFKSLHNDQNDNILTILVSGEPKEAFPELLTYENRVFTNPDQTQAVYRQKVEPLAANVTSSSTKASLKKLDTEILRLAAPILGCSYDDLFQRHQRRKIRRMWTVSLSVAAFFLVFGSISFYQATRISFQSREITGKNTKLLENQSRYLTSLAEKECDNGDKYTGLLLTLAALPGNIEAPDRPILPETVFSLRNILFGLTYGRSMENPFIDQVSSDLIIGQNNPESYAICFSPDGNRMLIKDLYGIYIYNTENGRYIGKISSDDSYIAIDFINNDRILAVFRNKLLLINASSGRVERRIAAPAKFDITNAVIARNGQYAALANSNLSVTVINLAKDQPAVHFNLAGYLTGYDLNSKFNSIALRFSPDADKIIALTTSEKTNEPRTVSQVFILDLARAAVDRHFVDALIPELNNKTIYADDLLYYCGTANEHRSEIYDWNGRLVYRLPPENVLNITFDEDSRCVAVAYPDRIAIYDLEKGSLLSVLNESLAGHTGTSLKFSPDGSLLAVLGKHSVLYDITSKSIIYNSVNPADYTCSQCDFTRNGRFFYCFVNKPGIDRKDIAFERPTLTVLNLRKLPQYTARIYLQKNIPAMRDYYRCPPISFDPNSNKMALSITEGVHIYNLIKKPALTKNPYDTIIAYSDGVIPVYSSDQKRLFISSPDVLVYDFSLQRAIFDYRGHQGFTDKDLKRVTILDQNALKVFSIDDQKLIFSYQTDAQLSTAAMNDKGNSVAAGDIRGQVYIFSTGSKNYLTLALSPSPIARISYSPNQSLLAVAQIDGTVDLIEVKSGRLRKKINNFKKAGQHFTEYCDLVFNDDNSMLMITNAERREVLNIDTGELLASSQGGFTSRDFENAAFIDEHKYFVLKGKKDKGSQMLTIADAAEQRVVFSSNYYSFAVSPDRKYLAVMDHPASNIDIFDISSDPVKKTVTIINDNSKNGNLHFAEDSMRFSYDGRYLITYNDEQKPLIWDCRNGNMITRFDTMIKVSISPDDKQILSSSSLYYNNSYGYIIPLLSLEEMIGKAQGYLTGSDHMIRRLNQSDKERYFIAD